MENFKKVNNLFGWIVFAIATSVYFLTLEPTASWWDCGEYIATAYKLQVGHPPGAPFFQLLGRFFTLFAFGDLDNVALMINIMSALSSSFTILFLFWTITMLAKKIMVKSGNTLPSVADGWAIIGAGVVGSLAYTFSDSFWFSAVEGEVYAMSSFFTAVVVWAILRWEEVADHRTGFRWLLLISFIIGLSIGVHLLNLLAIPAIVYVFYFKKYKFSIGGFIVAGTLSLIILSLIMYSIIPGIVSTAGAFELFFVNDIGLPFNSGTMIYFLFLILTIIIALYSSQNGNKLSFAIGLSIFLFFIVLISTNIIYAIVFVILFVILYLSTKDIFLTLLLMFTGLLPGYIIYHFLPDRLKKIPLSSLRQITNVSVLAFLFILIGYSSFFMLVIRANANTPINENDPKDAISLLSYLNREQYGSWPIFYGQYYNAPIVDHADGNPVYMQDEKKGKYIVKDDKKGTIPVYDERFMTMFPRMWSNTKPAHKTLYEHFGGVEGRPISVSDGKGGSKVLYRPTFGENLTYFFRYQINFMYVRYFMWNFAGRQNNIESQGEVQHGNWISGIGLIDSWRLGDQSNLPASMKNPARTQFYFLPLILGLIGFFFQLNRSKNDTWVVSLIFIMTGLAIIVYLNQTPLQPRERDYAYAGSFYAFAIWIGFGVLGLFNALQKKMGNKVMAAGIVSVACLMLVPGIMAEQGWDAHDRSGKYSAADFAKTYLASCEPNAILFTNGDNDTFPLWYVQEVEDFRTDVRVVNYMLSSGDWYVSQMGRKVYDSDRLPLTINQDFYKKKGGYVPVFERVDEAELIDAIRFIENDDKGTRVPLQSGNWIDYLPAKKLILPIDKEAVVASGTVAIEDTAKIVDKIEWTVSQGGLYRNDLMLLDLIATNNWERPIYFANPNSHRKVFDVDKYCHLEGVVYRLKPTIATEFMKRIGGVNADRTYEVIMDESIRWGRLNEDDVIVDRESSRNAGMAKQNYVRLAQALLKERKYDSVVEVLDRGIEFFPPEKFPFDYFMVSWADFYYKAGATEKANDLVNQIVERYEEDLAYYGSLNEGFMDDYEEDIREAMYALQRLIQLTKQNKQEELSKELEESFYGHMATFQLQ